MKIKEIAFTGYPVTDMPRARDFYEKVLGLTPSTAFGHEGRWWVEYDIGNGTLAINNLSPGQWKPSSDGPSVALEVEDFDAAVQALRAAHVHFVLEPQEYPSCRLAVFHDPDGNSLALHQRHRQTDESR